jgi:hypothetical protein
VYGLRNICKHVGKMTKTWESLRRFLLTGAFHSSLKKWRLEIMMNMQVEFMKERPCGWQSAGLSSKKGKNRCMS